MLTILILIFSFLLLLFFFFTPKYPPKQLLNKTLQFKYEFKWKERKAKGQRALKVFTFLQQFHKKKKIATCFSVTESQLNLSRSTDVQLSNNQTDCCLFNYHTKELPFQGALACCSPSCQDNLPEPNPPFNLLASILLGDLYKTESTFSDFVSSSRL